MIVLQTADERAIIRDIVACVDGIVILQDHDRNDKAKHENNRFNNSNHNQGNFLFIVHKIRCGLRLTVLILAHSNKKPYKSSWPFPSAIRKFSEKLKIFFSMKSVDMRDLEATTFRPFI
jgi:hypothetical protein